MTLFEDKIRCAEDMELQILQWGFLPFFRCGIPGFSIEEMTDILNNKTGFVKAMWCGSKKCEERIKHFIESGDVTVLFVSHSIEQVERICKRAVWIEKGDLRMDGKDQIRRQTHGRLFLRYP